MVADKEWERGWTSNGKSKEQADYLEGRPG
jgi:hypothetical protein